MKFYLLKYENLGMIEVTVFAQDMIHLEEEIRKMEKWFGASQPYFMPF